MKNKVLQILENDARLTAKQIALMLSKEEGDIKKLIEECEDERSICGYHTIIDWEKTGKESVKALIELKITPQQGKGFDSVAEHICNFDEVKSVYLMSGGFDLALIIEGKTMREIAYFVADRLATLENVTATATHFVLQSYKQDGFILTSEEEDKRGNMI